MKQLIIKYQIVDENGIITSEDTFVVEATEEIIQILKQIEKLKTT